MLRHLMGLPYRDKFDFSRLRGCFDDPPAPPPGPGPIPTPTPAPAPTPTPTPTPITFPDEASLMRRIAQGSKQALEATAKELGFESVDAMKAAAKAKAESDLAAKSDLEKEKARADKAEAEKKDALTAANTRLMSAEIKVFAVQSGFVDPADAVALVDKTGIAVDDAGNITGAKEAVEALAKAKPHLLGTGKPGGTPGSAGNGNRQDGTPGDDTEFATNLAKKRADQNKAAVDHQSHYFK